MYHYKYNLSHVVHVYIQILYVPLQEQPVTCSTCIYIQILYVPLQVQPVTCSTYNCTQVIESPFSNIYHVWSSSYQNELAF